MTEKNGSRGPSPARSNPSKGPSPSTGARLSSADVDAYAIPIRKTNPLIYVGAGVVALGIVGVVVFSGSDKSSPSVDPEAKLSPDAPQTLTKEEQKERLEHLRKTQAALEAAALEEKANAKSAAPGNPTPPAAAEPSSAPAKAPAEKQASAPKSEEPKKKASDAQSKKKAADLDALGADITSALK